jgi:hypothetical protein
MIESYYVPCVRRRYVRGVSSTGRVTETHTDTQINGYVGSRSQNAVQVADKDTLVVKYKFYCDDFDLAFGDCVLYNNILYRVTGNPQNTVNKNHHIKTEITLINAVTKEV